MSRMPANRAAYGYAHQTHHHQMIAPNYYYEDTEGYVADYSESDALSEGPHLIPTCAAPAGPPNQPPQPSPPPPPPQAHPHAHPHTHPGDVTEIYRRKTAAAAPPERYQGFYLHPEYYYEVAPLPVHPQQTVVGPPPPPQQVRRLTTTMPTPGGGYRRRIPVIDEVTMSPLPPQRYSYYPRQDCGEEGYDAMIYRSSPQITTATRRGVSPLRVPSATLVRTPSRVAIRRHPVTVRTPRYYRRPSAVYKKTSALCLPLSCQPDPAVYRRSRRVVQEQTYKHPQEVLYQAQTQEESGKILSRRHSIAVTNDNNVHSKETSKESIEETNSEFDAMLAKYEKMFRDTKAEGDAKRCNSPTNKSPSVNKNTPNLKPKLPPSVKAKQEKIKVKSAKSTREGKEFKQTKNIERLEVEQITTEVLDNLLNELMNANNENVEPETVATEKTKTHPTKNDDNTTQNDPNVEKPPKKNPHSENSLPKSFNYSDISQSISNTQNFLDSEFNHPPRPEPPLEETQIVPQNPSRSNITNNMGSPRRCSQRVSLDESSALELHRSKSYIVNLIDRALSRELGTVPEEKGAIKDCTLYPKNTIESSSKHGACKMDKDMCMDLSHALTDPYTNPSSSGHCDQRQEMVCPCSSNLDEPLYVKQLKQLRWGHLKHIQREVRRLEDLERFLDSCASGPYYN